MEKLRKKRERLSEGVRKAQCVSEMEYRHFMRWNQEVAVADGPHYLFS